MLAIKVTFVLLFLHSDTRLHLRLCICPWPAAGDPRPFPRCSRVHPGVAEKRGKGCEKLSFNLWAIDLILKSHYATISAWQTLIRRLLMTVSKRSISGSTRLSSWFCFPVFYTSCWAHKTVAAAASEYIWVHAFASPLKEAVSNLWSDIAKSSYVSLKTVISAECAKLNESSILWLCFDK